MATEDLKAMLSDPRVAGTGIGAVLGVLAVRGLLPEQYRTGTNYAAGAGIGGGAGLLSGSYLNTYGGPMRESVRRMVSGKEMSPGEKIRSKGRELASMLDANPAGAPSDQEMKTIRDLFGQKDYDAGIGSPVDADPFYRELSTPTANLKRMYRQQEDKLRNELSARRARQVGNIAGAEKAERRAETAVEQPGVLKRFGSTLFEPIQYVKELVVEPN